MTIKILRKRKDKNIILGVEKKVRDFFLLFDHHLFTSLSFLLSDKKNLIPTFLLVCFYEEKMSHFQSR